MHSYGATSCKEARKHAVSVELTLFMGIEGGGYKQAASVELHVVLCESLGDAQKGGV